MSDITKIRFIYAQATRHNSLFTGSTNLELELDVHKSLNIPQDMDLEEVYSLVWYLSSIVNARGNHRESVGIVIDRLKENGFNENDDENAGYKHVTYEYVPFKKYSAEHICPEIDSCLDILVVDGDRKLFDKISLSSRNTEWYAPINPQTNNKRR